MTPYNSDITRALKWLHNNAPAMQSLIKQKADWYSTYQTQFWDNWRQTVFDLRTATPFGLMIWSIILGVPSQVFGLNGISRAFAYGSHRQNFVYSGGVQPASNRNTVGGNFAGGGQTTVVSLDEGRKALMLRYAALTSNGSMALTNYMLRYIFNHNQPWDYPSKKYFYLMDQTGAAGSNPTSTPYYLEYRIGSGLNLSPQLVNLFNLPQYGIMPTSAGKRYSVIVEP